MKRYLVYLLAFLCFALAGCSDDDDGSNQPKYKLVNETGCLYYDKDLEAWIVVPKLGENRLLPDRRLEFGECVYYVIKNVPKISGIGGENSALQWHIGLSVLQTGNVE